MIDWKAVYSYTLLGLTVGSIGFTFYYLFNTEKVNEFFEKLTKNIEGKFYNPDKMSEKNKLLNIEDRTTED